VKASCAGSSVRRSWHALVEHGKVIAGQTVLLQGTGGVSVFGLQLAHAMGLQVVITSSSDEKLERAGNLGANKGINYKSTPNEHFTSSILCYLNGGDRA
jgi:NADPH:quinone reductase-like Zn-dependent oxidoreductase